MIHTGSVAFINQGDKEVRPGDIVTYRLTGPSGSDTLVTHRVIRVQDGVYTTRGDANETEDLSPVTREQLVVMLYRYMGEPAVSGSSLGRFSDSGNVSGWASQAMSWAVANGVVNGSNGALNPQGSATRAEVASILSRFCQFAG